MTEQLNKASGIQLRETVKDSLKFKTQRSQISNLMMYFSTTETKNTSDSNAVDGKKN